MAIASSKSHIPHIPHGTRVYAVGDIHGRLDLLEILHQSILDDAKSAPGHKNVLIHLGDYIDRGPDSFGVVDSLAEFSPHNVEVINLKGNHEDFLLRFLGEKKGPSPLLDVWRDNGCLETFLSYGIDIRDPKDRTPDEQAAFIRQQFAEAVPDSHMRFYKGLRLRQTIGDYLFVHAGINPANPIQHQKKNDLIWIRGRFLNHSGPFDKVVVHGHTISKSPEVLDHRIGIDTGAYYSHRLTCLVLEGNDRYFLET
ncbi:metallophosphoesterase [bacterium]|jgi:serine/threonine protein phosphatase 1|nr:metallophosphoesterase [bacterium]